MVNMIMVITTAVIDIYILIWKVEKIENAV